MDADFTAQFVQNLPLHPVNDIMNSGDITVLSTSACSEANSLPGP